MTPMSGLCSFYVYVYVNDLSFLGVEKGTKDLTFLRLSQPVTCLDLGLETWNNLHESHVC